MGERGYKGRRYPFMLPVRVDQIMHDQLHGISEATDRPVSWIVRHAIREYLIREAQREPGLRREEPT